MEGLRQTIQNQKDEFLKQQTKFAEYTSLISSEIKSVVVKQFAKLKVD